MEFLIGIGCGIVISLCFSFGPAFFSLLQTSAHYGFRTSVPIAFGINANDILVVSLLLTILKDTEMGEILHNPYIAVGCGVVLAAFGVYSFTRKATDAESEGTVMKFKTLDAPKWYFVYARGFIINFCNPLIWLYWLSIITMATVKFEISTDQLFVFFAGVLITTVSLDVLKCKLASLLQRFLTARVLNILNKVVGCVLIGFAVYLVVSLIMNFK